MCVCDFGFGRRFCLPVSARAPHECGAMRSQEKVARENYWKKSRFIGIKIEWKIMIYECTDLMECIWCNRFVCFTFLFALCRSNDQWLFIYTCRINGGFKLETMCVFERMRDLGAAARAVDECTLHCTHWSAFLPRLSYRTHSHDRNVYSRKLINVHMPLFLANKALAVHLQCSTARAINQFALRCDIAPGAKMR